MKRILIGSLTFFLLLSGCNAETQKPAEKPAEQPTQTQTSGVNKSMTNVKMETSKGTIVLALDANKAPLTVANIEAYIKDGFYDGLVFHRVIPNFMVQGGGMNADMSEKADKRAPIKNEANNGLKNDRGTLAMARTPDPHSASSQFFVNVADNAFLNFKSETSQGWGYAVFGKVTDGMDVVDTIVGVKTGTRGGHQDVPAEPVTIDKATVIE